MSIDVTQLDGDPDPSPFECETCWPVSDTSNSLFMCLQGIEKGNMWAPGDPEPPNDSFELVVFNTCHWQRTTAGFVFTYKIFGVASQFQVRIPLGLNAFFQFMPPACQIWQANLFQNPAGQKYYGGWCTVIPRVNGGPFSMPDLMSLVSENLTWASWLQPRPMENDQVVYGLYGGPTHSNIRIKIDHS